MAVADFDLDGRPDLAVPNYGSSSVSVLTNTTPPAVASEQPATLQ
jgi:hypothetical protein